MSKSFCLQICNKIQHKVPEKLGVPAEAMKVLKENKGKKYFRISKKGRIFFLQDLKISVKTDK